MPLAHDMELYSDGGGKRIAALKAIHGREKVLRFLAVQTQLAHIQ